MENIPNCFWFLFYWGKLYTQSLKQGDGYNKAKRTIVILIANFELNGLEFIKKYMTKWQIREEEYSSVVLTDVFEAVILELPKFTKYADTSKSENMNLWVKFIKNPEVKFMDDVRNNKELKETIDAIEEAQKKLEDLSQDEHERELAHLRDKYIRDQYSVEKFGYERGIKEGETKSQIEIAKKMLKKNYDVNTISELTDLTIQEIESLK